MASGERERRRQLYLLLGLDQETSFGLMRRENHEGSEPGRRPRGAETRGRRGRRAERAQDRRGGQEYLRNDKVPRIRLYRTHNLQAPPGALSQTHARTEAEERSTGFCLKCVPHLVRVYSGLRPSFYRVLKNAVRVRTAPTMGHGGPPPRLKRRTFGMAAVSVPAVPPKRRRKGDNA